MKTIARWLLDDAQQLQTKTAKNEADR